MRGLSKLGGGKRDYFELVVGMAEMGEEFVEFNAWERLTGRKDATHIIGGFEFGGDEEPEASRNWGKLGRRRGLW